MIRVHMLQKTRYFYKEPDKNTKIKYLITSYFFLKIKFE